MQLMMNLLRKEKTLDGNRHAGDKMMAQWTPLAGKTCTRAHLGRHQMLPTAIDSHYRCDAAN